MLVYSLIALAIAFLAICINSNATDEIVQVAATITAGLCLFLSLIFAPWLVKLLILMTLWAVTKKHVNSWIPRTF